MVILLIGPKGAGKSTLREWLEQRGWKSVYVEALYDEFDKARAHTVDAPSEDLRDLVYRTARDRMIEQAKTHDVVFDGTGSSFRFDAFYNAVKAACDPCRLVFVDAPRELAYARTQQRNADTHRPFDRAYFDRVYDDCHKRLDQADAVIENNTTRSELLRAFQTWLFGQSCQSGYFGV